MSRGYILISTFFLCCLLTGCSKADPAQQAQQATVQRVEAHIDSLHIMVEQARLEGKKWKIDRWREAFARFDEAEAPIGQQLRVLGTEAEKLPHRPEQIKAWLDQLAELKMEIERARNQLTEVAKKTKNGKAVIAAPAAATESAKGAPHK